MHTIPHKRRCVNGKIQFIHRTSDSPSSDTSAWRSSELGRNVSSCDCTESVRTEEVVTRAGTVHMWGAKHSWLADWPLCHRNSFSSLQLKSETKCVISSVDMMKLTSMQHWREQFAFDCYVTLWIERTGFWHCALFIMGKAHTHHLWVPFQSQFDWLYCHRVRAWIRKFTVHVFSLRRIKMKVC